MSWIQENKFVAGLAAATLVGALALGYWGSRSKQATAEAVDRFESASGGIERLESASLYPSAENRDLKRKAVAEYIEQADVLRNRMLEFRPEEIVNIPPNDFTDELQAANKRVTDAFAAAGTQVPSEFFLGFEAYTNSPARGGATGILTYQLGAMEWLFTRLAEAKADSLLNVHRPRLPEEDGGEATYGETQVARDLPVEITFSGNAAAMRGFLGAVVDAKDYYFIPRVIQVRNERQEGPTRAEAEFKAAPAAAPAAAQGGFDFGSFDIPTEEDAEDEADPAAAEAPEAPAPAAPVEIDSSQILKQVLGNERVTVFLRIDIRLFRPAEEVPLPELPN